MFELHNIKIYFISLIIIIVSGAEIISNDNGTKIFNFESKVEIWGNVYENEIINGISGKVYSMRVDSKLNIYYRDYSNIVHYLKTNSKYPESLKTVGLSFDIAIDGYDNVYVATNGGVHHVAEISQTRLIEGAIKSIYNDNNTGYLYVGLVTGGVYRISNCLLRQIRFFYDRITTPEAYTPTLATYEAIIADSSESIAGISDVVKKLAVSSKGHIFYIVNGIVDAFVLEQGQNVPRKIYLGGAIMYDVKVDDGDNVYFAGVLGLYVYRDDGYSWSAAKINITVGTVYTVFPHDGDIYLGCDGFACILKKKIS